MLQGKQIMLGISGGIAAYKAVSLCSALVQAGAEVKVVMTEGATQFVTPLTLQTISRHRVITDVFAEEDPSVVSHIDLADHSDLIVIAPATANIIAKMAHGIADDMLSTTMLATEAPIMVAPAMNVHMYAHPAVQANMQMLQARGVRLIEPGTGQLACGYVGKGRLAEPEVIFNHVRDMFVSGGELSGRHVLVTAGGTIERIDPVRYLTNDSSGKMGFAIASAAKQMGAKVTLLAANTSLQPPQGIQVIRVTSAQEMYDQVMALLPQVDLIVKAAAVADYRPVQVAEQKMKKDAEQQLTLTLERTPDILAEIGQRKTSQFVIGFAAETEQLAHHAMSKLQRKRCDLLVANDVSKEGIGFGSDTNAVTIFDANGQVEQLPVQSKAQIASRILTIAAERLKVNGS